MFYFKWTFVGISQSKMPYKMMPFKMERPPQQHFSRIVSDRILSDGYETADIPDFGFELDDFQKKGIYYLNKRESVFIAAHTSSGKTLLAHFCIIRALQNGQKVIYTSPIKALSNQKYYEFRKIYSKESENVGIITGDVQINEDAPILIMTTEILRNRLFKNTLDNIGYVIFDEIHYINDKERGVVWEESIIQLDRSICLLFLSATISNPLEFSEWVGRIKNKIIYVIQTEKRVIPLKYILFKNVEYFDINGKKIPEMNTSDTRDTQNTIWNPIRKEQNKKMLTTKKEYKKFSLTLFLQKIRFDSLPAIFFCFSRNKCEEYMNICSSISFLNAQERKKILDFLSYNRINSDHHKYWLKGISTHHSGLLPIEKETVEILFMRNLIKVLFATETMAMGLNMPAKSVVFLHPFKKGKILTTTPFLQMSGRAGRRGLDKEGKIFINIENTNCEELKRIIHGKPDPLVSTFRISFNLILNLTKYNFNVSQYLKHSFGELSGQRDLLLDNERKMELETLLGAASLSENHSVYELVKILHSIKSEDFLSDAEWAVSYDGVCGQIARFTSDRIYFKTGDHHEISSQIEKNSNMDRSPTLPFIDEIGENESVMAIRKKDCFIVGRGPVGWESAISYMKTLKATGHSLGLRLVENLQNLKRLEQEITKLRNTLRIDELRTEYSKAFKRYILKEESESLDYKLGEKGTHFYSEYENRLRFLKDYNYLDDMHLLMKGQIASEIRTLNDIVITEMIFENHFDNMTGEMIISLFSCFVCNEREIPRTKTKISEIKTSYSNPEINNTKSCKIDLSFLNILERKVQEINDIYEKYGITESIVLNYIAVKSVYLWCQGNDLHTSTENEISKGAFVRVALRLHESLKEIQNVCNILQNQSLLEKTQKYESILVRDIICQESLYLKKELTPNDN